MNALSILPLRVIRGHPRTLAGFLAGALAYILMPADLHLGSRGVIAWDIGALVMLLLVFLLFVRHGDDERMAVDAMRQQEGEWTMFAITLAGVGFSFIALTTEMSGAKDMSPTQRFLHVALVAATLLISFLATHAIFALRYAHEFYTRSPGGAQVDGGLEFPGETVPDYWDFLYFALVLGMTFQVSDVQITSRTLRRLATLHGLIGFLNNTVIIGLTVNIMAGMM